MHKIRQVCTKKIYVECFNLVLFCAGKGGGGHNLQASSFRVAQAPEKWWSLGRIVPHRLVVHLSVG